jgi:hypothetical protein
MITAVEKLFNIWLNREYITEDEWLEAIEMEKEREKSIFSIAYRMTPIEFGKEYCELEFEKFNKTFKQQEQ